MVRLLSVTIEDGALDTDIVYVLIVVPSCAVTTIEITLFPTLKAIGPDALPDTTAVPLTVIVELASVAVGVTVILAVALLTLAA